MPYTPINLKQLDLAGYSPTDSIAQSMVVSSVLTESSDFSTASSQNISQSVLISTAQSTASAGGGSTDSVARSMATSVALAESSDISTASSQNTSQSILISVAQSSATGGTDSTARSMATSAALNASVADSKAVSDSVIISANLTTTNSQNTSQSVLISVAQSTADAGGGGGWVSSGSDTYFDTGKVTIGSSSIGDFIFNVNDTSSGDGWAVRFQKNISSGQFAGLLIGGGPFHEGFIQYFDNSDAAARYFGFGIGGDAGAGVAIFNGGRLTVNGATPSYNFNVNGDSSLSGGLIVGGQINAANLTSTLGINMVQQDGSGFLVVQTLASDPRLKNIKTTRPIYGLKELRAIILKGGLITFSYKKDVKGADSTKVHNGFNAAIIKEEMPLSVMEADDEDKTLVLNDSSLKSLLNTAYASIDELAAKVEKQEKDIAELKNQIAELIKKIS